MRCLPPGLRWLIDLPSRFDEALDWDPDPFLDRDDGELVASGWPASTAVDAAHLGSG